MRPSSVAASAGRKCSTARCGATRTSSLAHQYIAAVLNIGAGASAPNSLRAIVLAAGSWFSTAVPGTWVKGACQLQRSWAGVLDEYNNGDYPGAPKHCDED